MDCRAGFCLGLNQLIPVNGTETLLSEIRKHPDKTGLNQLIPVNGTETIFSEVDRLTASPASQSINPGQRD